MLVSETRNAPRDANGQVLKQQLVNATRLHDGIRSPRIRMLLESRIRDLKAEVAFFGR